MGRCFKLFTSSRLLDINDGVEGQMPLIQCVAAAGKFDWSDSILLKKFFEGFLFHTTSEMRIQKAVSLRTKLPYSAPYLWTVYSLPGQRAGGSVIAAARDPKLRNTNTNNAVQVRLIRYRLPSRFSASFSRLPDPIASRRFPA